MKGNLIYVKVYVIAFYPLIVLRKANKQKIMNITHSCHGYNLRWSKYVPLRLFNTSYCIHYLFSMVATWLFPPNIHVFSFRLSFLARFHIQTGFNGFTFLVKDCPQGSNRSEKSNRNFIINYASNDWFTVKRCAINGDNCWPLAAWQELIVNLLNNVSVKPISYYVVNGRFES